MHSTLRRELSIVVAALALGASLTSLTNGYALDDLPIILNNSRIHSLSAPWAYFGQTYWPPESGPALYRPLAVLFMAIEWAIGAGSPLVFHLANVLTYVTASLVTLWLALELLPPPAAFLAAALFAVHPVHVEAVGNAVGQPEILVGILVPLAVAWYVKARRAGALRVRDGAVLAAVYAAALVTKEHAIVLPGLIVLAELLLVNDAAPVRSRIERMIPVLLGFAAVLVSIWSIRTMVTGGLVGRDIHPAFRNGDTATRIWTMLGVVPEWIRLLLFPLHLSADYNPQEIPIATALGARQLAGLGMLGLTATLVLNWRRHPVIAFGILWTAVALFPVSNLLIPTGILLAERTLFLPSVGAMLAIGGAAAALLPALQRLNQARRQFVFAGLWLVVFAGSVRSALRQPVWRDNLTLFSQTALDAPRSYKALAGYGVMLFAAGEDEAGERAYRRGLGLYRDDPNLFSDLGDWYLQKGRCEDALAAYARVLELVPAHWAATSRSILCLIRLGRLEEARKLAATAASRGDEGGAEKLGYVDSLIGAR